MLGLKDRFLLGRLYLAVNIAIASTFGLTSYAPGQSAPSDAQATKIERQLADIQLQIERLSDLGQTEAAGNMAGELKLLREQLTGSCRIPKGDSLELHMVSVREGAAAPPGVLTGKDRFITGYVQVNVTHTAHPIILVLCGIEPIHWMVNPAPGARFAAVVLSGPKAQSVSGLPKHTLVLGGHSDPRYQMFAANRQDADRYGVNRALRRLTGREPRTIIGRRQGTGKPLIVGPENPLWRAEYVAGEIDDLSQRATEHLRRKEIAELAQLRFRAISYVSRDRMHPDAAIGDYSVRGPIVPTLRPINPQVRCLVDVAPEKTQFALNQHWELVLYDPLTGDYPKVRLGAEMERDRNFQCMAYDSRRRRLMLCTRHNPPTLYAYELDNATWKKLGQPAARLAALVYEPGEDVFYAVDTVGRDGSPGFPAPAPAPAPSEDPFSAGSARRVVKLDPHGKLLHAASSSQTICPTDCGIGSVHMAFVDGLLLVASPPVRQGYSQLVSHVTVVDPSFAKVLYHGVQLPHDGRGHVDGPATSPPPQIKGDDLQHVLRKSAQVEQAIGLMEKRNLHAQANRFRQRLGVLGKRLGGDYSEKFPDSGRVHYLGVRETPKITVKVTDTSRPITLLLWSLEPIQWDLEVADGVDLRRILLLHKNRAQINGVPDGVQVDDNIKQPSISFVLDRRHPGFRQTSRIVSDWIGFEMASFQFQWDKNAPFMVGPDCVDWRMQDVECDLDQLLSEAERLCAPEIDPALQDLRFWAVLRPQGTAGFPDAAPAAPSPEEGSSTPRPARSAPSPRYVQCTIRGPIADTAIPIRAAFDQLAADSHRTAFYARRGYDVGRIDVDARDLVKIPLGAGLPRLSHPSAIAFDYEREHLLLTTFGGGGYLYRCDVRDDKWSILSQPGLSLGAMVYSGRDDAIFGTRLTLGGESIAELCKFNPYGAIIRVIPLEQSYGAGSPQLICADGFLILLDRTPSSANGSYKIYVVDPTDGRIAYTGDFRSH